ncbi:hypothetical protein GpartN1_g3589.t1 [Galdieria partita]|uniref:Transcription factor TFIIIC triple barrel domain-containing protein n=1 Tax=Galdieria partita TaxID=83374 RepID=A0A9C7UQE0_9RHOD|nr:hypothetical protein GpartN1_g3589.t1 [Galdieria partita]
MVLPTETDEENTTEETIVEEYVLLKLPQTAKFLTSSATHFRLIGLEEGKPFLQIGNEVFQGSFEKPLGTVLLFGDQDGRNSQETEMVKPSSWGLIGCTEETVKFEKVQLRKKNTASETDANSGEGPSSCTIQGPKKE